MKKQRIARTELAQRIIKYWLSEGMIFSGLQRKEEYYDLSYDEYDWREDKEIKPWAREILEDDNKLLQEWFGDDDFQNIELFDAKVQRQVTEEEII